MFTEQLTQSLAVLGQLPFSNHATNTGDNSIAGIDMSVIRRLITIADVGVCSATGNYQLYYAASANSNMAGPVNVAASVPLTGNTSNRVSTLEVRADQLPAGTRYVQPVLIVNTATINIGLIVLGGESGYKPANQFNKVNVADQQVVT